MIIIIGKIKLYKKFKIILRCIDKKKTIYYALKILNKNGLKQDQFKLIDAEIDIYKKNVCLLLPHLN